MLLQRPAWLPRGQVPSYVPPPRGAPNMARGNAPAPQPAAPVSGGPAVSTAASSSPASSNTSFVRQPHEPSTSGPGPAPQLPHAPFPTPEPVEGAVDKEVQFVSHDRAGFRVDGHMALPGVDQALVMDILTDFDACPRVFHNIERCSSERLPSGDKRVVQTCRWGIIGFNGSFDAEFEVHEERDNPGPGEGHVEFNLIKSNFMRNFQGHWHVYPAPATDHRNGHNGNSSTASSGCYVEHSMLVKPAVPLPGPIAKFANGIFVSQVQNILDDLEAEVVRRVATAGTSQAVNRPVQQAAA